MSGYDGATLMVIMLMSAAMLFELYVLHEWKKLDALEKKAKRKPKGC